VLAYVFWHRPRSEADIEAYETALIGFHRSLAHSRPVGLEESASFRVAELPWIAGEGAGYEDWYLLDGFSSLGVLNEAAVGRGHRTAHDHAARQTALGTAGLYALQDGDTVAWERGAVGVWVEREPGSAAFALSDLLTDGLTSEPSCLWRRQMSFGPAPEFCLHASQAPAGVATGRLPERWRARTIVREALGSG
jgi:hypothetical protein